MRRALTSATLAILTMGACETGDILVPIDGPAAPRDLAAAYHAQTVTVTWTLAPAWHDEPFRVYSKRSSDDAYFLIAEVTSCANGFCAYEDVNVLAGRTYDYYVAAVDPVSGVEAPSEYSVSVSVPQPVPPPVPDGIEVIALDDANYVRWSDRSRDAADFSFYRVYMDPTDGDEFLLGETDSEGFLDLLAENGRTYRYFVTAVDDQGHESAGSDVGTGTPRPDYHGEWVYDYADQPASSGFRFRSDEDADPIVSGNASDRHFRLEVDASGWWLVPGPQAAVYPVGFETTALKCGVAADATCSDVTRAPSSGYVVQDVELVARTSYVLRVRGDDGQNHYGVIRVEMLGYDQSDDALMFFDWAYQLQPGNPELAPGR